MSNSYFNNSRTLLPLSKARADDVESKFDLVGAGFDAVETAVDLKAPLASPALTGTPTAPTAVANTNTTQIATTAHVFAERSNPATLTNKTLTSPVINSPTGLVKADVGLGNVDNTSDLNKPVSTATQSALDLKAPLASPALTGVPTAPTAATGTNTTQIATTEFVTQTAFASTLPDQTGNSGKYLTTDGSAASWSTVNFGAGTVTSVAASVPAFLSVSGSPITASGTLAISLSGNALPETSGGTGQTSYAVGDLLYAGTTTTLAKLPDVATGNALLSGGVNTAPAWGKVGLSTHVSGTLPAANGGTGQSSYTAGDLLYASAGNALSTLNAAATGNALISGGAGNPPSWGKISLATGSSHVTGTLPVGNGGTGAITLTGLVKGNGTSAFTAAVAGTDYVTPTGTETLTNKTLSGAILNDGYTEEIFAVTGTTPALSPTNGSIQTWTLTMNSTPTAGTWAAGQSITLMLDDGSAATISWTSLAVTWKTDGGTAPTLNTSGYTAIALWKVGSTIYGARVGDA